jgi:hypothetical protein
MDKRTRANENGELKAWPHLTRIPEKVVLDLNNEIYK